MTDTAATIRAYHAASGSVLVGEVTGVYGDAPHRSFSVIPEGLLEEVVLREGVWTVTDVCMRVR